MLCGVVLLSCADLPVPVAVLSMLRLNRHHTRRHDRAVTIHDG